jgi:hypothetical protein
MSAIDAAIEKANDLYLNTKDCATAIHRVQIPGHYEQVSAILADAAEELGVVASILPMKMLTPGGLIDGTEIQLINNPLRATSSMAVKYGLQKMALYLAATLPDVDAFMVISEGITTCYSRLTPDEADDE